eukprot:jgi/Chrzof1/1140/Cz01g42030.t1
MATPVDDTQVKDTNHDIANLSMREMMRLYYGRLFPCQQMHKWLAYGNDSRHAAADGSFFNRRELCFTLEGDIFVRYQSFKSATDLGAALQSKVPTKIDIGPVYTKDPRERAKYAKEFKPLQRELVFDIDLTDYDDVRTCGKEGHICNKCWGLMAVAIQVLDAALREDFGFKHILWVYSGRRGVHCWVCDQGARVLLDDVRGAVVSYLSVFRGTEGDKAKLSTGWGGNRPPSLDRAYEMLLEAWREHILPQQQLLEDPDMMQRLLRYIPDDELVEQLKRSWSVASSRDAGHGSDPSVSVRRWDELVQEVEGKAARLRSQQPGRSKANALLRAIPDIVFAHTYPRLDVEVSKKMNHLLKAPFCVHPKTGKVCIPIDPSAAWEFDPEAVPTVQQLLTELDTAPSATSAASEATEQLRTDSSAQEDAWQHTSLSASIKYFEDTFLAPLASAQRAVLNAKAKEQAAMAAETRIDLNW